MGKTCVKATHTTINDLPEDVIESILDILPIEDAVKTSALARSWRYKWTTLWDLTFGHDFLCFADFINIITKILLRHCGRTIRKFTLVVPNYHYIRVDPENIDEWMLFISKKDVEEFSLEYRDCSPKNFYKLPSHFYNFLSLTCLEVSNCVLDPPPGFGGFPELISLGLNSVTLDEWSFRDLISSCPLLDKLELSNCYHPNHLTIHSPSLKSLFLGVYSRDGLVSVHADAENQTTLWLNGGFSLQRPHPNHTENNLIEEIDRFSKIEELIIGPGVFQSFTAAGAPMRLLKPLIRLKRVEIGELDFTDRAQRISLHYLVRSAPKLQEINIVVACTRRKNVVKQVSSFLGQDWACNCLEKVILRNIIGSRPEIEFIKFVLGSSPSLQLMTIYADKALDDDVGSLMFEELLTFYKVSPNAEVVLKYSCSSQRI